MNEFGYDDRAPNPPFHLRDQLCKCARCGSPYVGTPDRICTYCAVQDISAAVVAMREPMRQMAGVEAKE